MPAVPLSQVAVHLRPEDNVAVAARDLPPGQEIDFSGGRLTVVRRVGMGHKLALRPIPQGQAVLKYGQVIGFASRDVAPGDAQIEQRSPVADVIVEGVAVHQLHDDVGASSFLVGGQHKDAAWVGDQAG